MRHLLLSSTILLAASTGLMAEEVGVGDPQAGFAYAKEVCANCHAIVSNETSPVPEAPAFDEIANRMSAKALFV
jgi:cytochrome c2